ncbi:hypothetical protein C8J56DRAFT_889069 [Mycena floridula]|nr:hypothetical protein C8J56DRAFT_889069 [Mycena floridula]
MTCKDFLHLRQWTPSLRPGVRDFRPGSTSSAYNDAYDGTRDASPTRTSALRASLTLDETLGDDSGEWERVGVRHSDPKDTQIPKTPRSQRQKRRAGKVKIPSLCALQHSKSADIIARGGDAFGAAAKFFAPNGPRRFLVQIDGNVFHPSLRLVFASKCFSPINVRQAGARGSTLDAVGIDQNSIQQKDVQNKSKQETPKTLPLLLEGGVERIVYSVANPQATSCICSTSDSSQSSCGWGEEEAGCGKEACDGNINTRQRKTQAASIEIAAMADPKWDKKGGHTLVLFFSSQPSASKFAIFAQVQCRPAASSYAVVSYALVLHCGPGFKKKAKLAVSLIYFAVSLICSCWTLPLDSFNSPARPIPVPPAYSSQRVSIVERFRPGAQNRIPPAPRRPNVVRMEHSEMTESLALNMVSSKGIFFCTSNDLNTPTIQTQLLFHQPPMIRVINGSRFADLRIKVPTTSFCTAVMSDMSATD